jgi:hypothetical protein
VDFFCFPLFLFDEDAFLARLSYANDTKVTDEPQKRPLKEEEVVLQGLCELLYEETFVQLLNCYAVYIVCTCFFLYTNVARSVVGYV